MLQKLIKRLTILSFILVMGAGLSGCAFKSIIYERLDWVVMYQLDSYLDMDKAQKLKFKPLVTEAITWLKRDKLPGAIVVFDKLILAAQNKSYDDTMSKALSAELDGIRVDLFKKYEAPIVSRDDATSRSPFGVHFGVATSRSSIVLVGQTFPAAVSTHSS